MGNKISKETVKTLYSCMKDTWPSVQEILVTVQHASTKNSKSRDALLYPILNGDITVCGYPLVDIQIKPELRVVLDNKGTPIHIFIPSTNKELTIELLEVQIGSGPRIKFDTFQTTNSSSIQGGRRRTSKSKSKRSRKQKQTRRHRPPAKIYSHSK
jgi:hypothetical protein